MIILVNNLNGKLRIVDNKLDQANIFAVFDNDNNFKFTINTKNGEKNYYIVFIKS